MLRPPDWKPTEDQKEHLLAFEGYGVEHPDIIFVGIEEYCYPDPERQRDGIWTRCTHSAFSERRVDKNKAHMALDPTRELKTVPVWRLMAEIVSALTGSTSETELEALGTRPSQGRATTWVTELRALPRPGTSRYRETYIPEWFGFARRADYENYTEAVSGQRILASLRHVSPPRYAFFYGKPACMWARDHLTPELEVPFRDEDDGIGVGRTRSGSCISLTGFYNGQHQASAFRTAQVPALLRRTEKRI